MTDPDPLDQLIGDPDTVRSAFAQVPVMLLCLDGPDMRFSAVNAAYRAFYPKFTMGQSLWDSAPVLIDQRINTALITVYETGEPLVTREWRVHLDVDGSGLQEVFIDMTVTPRRDTDGAVLGVQIMAQDATERVLARRAAEERAQELRERYESVRESATTMQQALLSPFTPVLPGLDIAAGYLVATQDTGAGGDWFDVVTPRGGVHAYLVVGDVVGHGVRAAAVMARLRTAVELQLRSGSDIGDALAVVDDFAADIPGAGSATLCVVRVDPATGEIEYCTAGHPPPLLITRGGPARYLEITGGRPLGAGSTFPTRRVRMAMGETIVLYSDGLIERPGRPAAASTVEVADVAARVLRGEEGFPLGTDEAPVQRLCSQAVELLVRATGYHDDITVLAAQRRPDPPVLDVDVIADTAAERTVRTRLRQWLDILGGDVASARIAEFVVTELVANAVRHAYPPRDPGHVRVTGILESTGHVHITVADDGHWTPPTGNDTGGGRGLSLAQAMTTALTIDRAETGTTATATHRLTRAAHIVTDPTTPTPAPATAATEFAVSVDVDGRIVVGGDVDTTAAPALAGVMATHGRAATRSLAVDLTNVTHLGSAAISVLAHADRRARDHATTCTLIAPPGGPAHHVLSLVGLITHTPQRDPDRP